MTTTVLETHDLHEDCLQRRISILELNIRNIQALEEVFGTKYGTRLEEVQQELNQYGIEYPDMFI